MFAIAQNHRWLTTLASPLIGAMLLGAPKAEAPTATEPHPVAAQRSATGKIVDRLPGNASAPPKFEAVIARPDREAATFPGGAMAFAPAAAKVTAIAAAAPVSTPIAIASVTPVRPHKASPVVATLPPRRPISLGTPQAVAQVAAAQQKRPSVTSRMFAFVGSLAGLANPL